MGYMSIPHLYKMPEFFEIEDKICVMEKIHCTSTYILLKDNGILRFHSGGAKNKDFMNLFDENFIRNQLTEIIKENGWQSIKIHGEAYGSNLLKMSHTYGNTLKFIVFDIHINVNNDDNFFLHVKEAENIAERLKLDFVPYVIGPNDISFIQKETEKESEQAIKIGMGSGKLREGVVVKFVIEKKLSDGSRAIAKHKNGPFWETKVPGQLGRLKTSNTNSLLDDKFNKYYEVSEIAENWVTDMRAEHVFDKILHEKSDDNKMITRADVKRFVDDMVKDVEKESEGEINWTEEIVRVMRSKAGQIFNKHLKTQTNVLL